MLDTTTLDQATHETIRAFEDVVFFVDGDDLADPEEILDEHGNRAFLQWLDVCGYLDLDGGEIRDESPAGDQDHVTRLQYRGGVYEIQRHPNGLYIGVSRLI